MTNKIYQDVEVRGKASATGQISGASLNVTGEINGAHLSSALLATLRDYFLPVGSRVKQRKGEQTPAAKFGGTWVVDTDYTGRTEIGSGTEIGSETDYELGATGGEATHTLTVEEIPPHSHLYYTMTNSQVGSSVGAPPRSNGTGTEVTSSTLSVGGGQSHNNMPPYKVVTVWKRTA